MARNRPPAPPARRWSPRPLQPAHFMDYVVALLCVAALVGAVCGLWWMVFDAPPPLTHPR